MPSRGDERDKEEGLVRAYWAAGPWSWALTGMQGGGGRGLGGAGAGSGGRCLGLQEMGRTSARVHFARRYGMRYVAKVLRTTLAEKFPDAPENEVYKASVPSPPPQFPYGPAGESPTETGGRKPRWCKDPSGESSPRRRTGQASTAAQGAS